MCQLVSLSLTELNKFSKEQLVALVLADRPPVAEPSIDTLDAKGRLVKRQTTYRDAAGQVTHVETVESTYYPTGEIDTILVYRRDAAGKAMGLAKQVKHSRCLKGYEPPVLSLIAVPVQGPLEG
jgi:hypothetical protein